MSTTIGTFLGKISFKVIFFFALASVGLLAVLPQVLIWRGLDEKERPYLAANYLTNNDEVKIYLPRAREVYDGHFLPAGLSFNESGVSPFNLLPSLLVSLFFFLFQGDVNLAYLGMQFVFSMVIFVSFYLWGQVLWRDRVWSLLFALLALLTPLARYANRVVWGVSDFLSLAIKNFYPWVRTPIEYQALSKADDPLITFAIFIPALAALFYFWSRPSKKSAFLLGILLGLMFYTYLHYWIYLVILSGLLFGLAFWERRENPIVFRNFVPVWLIAAVVAIPYFVNYFFFVNSETAQEFMARSAFIEYGRYFRWQGALKEYGFYLLAALVVLVSIFRKDKNRAIVYFASILAMFAAWNVQLITGYTFVSNHWPQVFNPLVLAIGIDSAQFMSRRFRRRSVVIFAFLLLTLLLAKKINNVLQFTDFSQSASFFKKHALGDGLVDSWSWLNANVPGEPVIASPSFLSAYYLNLYTSGRSYLPYWPHSTLSNRDVEQRFIEVNKSFGISESMFANRLGSYYTDCNTLAGEADHLRGCDAYTIYNLQDAGADLYGAYFLPNKYEGRVNFWNTDKGYVSGQKKEELINRYQSAIDGFDSGADYFYFGRWEKELAGQDRFRMGELDLVYKNQETEMYRIRKIK